MDGAYRNSPLCDHGVRNTGHAGCLKIWFAPLALPFISIFQSHLASVTVDDRLFIFISVPINFPKAYLYTTFQSS